MSIAGIEKKGVKPNQEYFVTLGIMTEDCNPGGHSYMLISTINNTQGDKAKVEVLEAVGLYSRYMPVLGFKPYGRGRVRTESPKDLVGKDGLYHQTFQITQKEMGELLTAVNEDRRKIGNEKPCAVKQYDSREKNINNEQEEHHRPGGPIFNLFSGDNCKRYVLTKLENLGIDVEAMHGFLEIPKLSSNMHPLKMIQGKRDVTLREDAQVFEDEQAGEEFFEDLEGGEVGGDEVDHHDKVVYYWDSPLLLHPRKKKPSLLEEERIKASRQYLALVEGVDQIAAKLENREDTLRSQGRQVKEITDALTKMQLKKHQLEEMQHFPNKMNAKRIQRCSDEVSGIVTECTDALKQRGGEGHFIKSLLDTLAEMYYKIRYAVWGWSKSTSPKASLPNTLDVEVGNEIDEIQSQIPIPSMRP